VEGVVLFVRDGWDGGVYVEVCLRWCC